MFSKTKSYSEVNLAKASVLNAFLNLFSKNQFTLFLFIINSKSKNTRLASEKEIILDYTIFFLDIKGEKKS